MVQCPVCGFENRGTPLFCGRCTSPLGVVGLHELNDRERRRCLSALFEVLSEVAEDDGRSSQYDTDKDLWQAYLNAFWLRPETALILYAEAMAIRTICPKVDAPWLDLGCGDGIHAAIYSGWRFEAGFDAFSCLDLQAADIYNRFDPAEFSAPIHHRGRMVDYGIDIKETAVARARALGVFAEVRQADATKLPLADQSVGFIYSNMLRDLGEPLGAALAECRRVLRDDGVMLLSAMTPKYADNLYFAPAAWRAMEKGDGDLAEEMMKLDRGRCVFCRRQLSIEQWEELLGRAGLKLCSTPIIVGSGAIRFWDVGLRPFAHALLAQRQAWLDGGILTQVKQSLLMGVEHVLKPLLGTLRFGEPCMRMIEVRKR